GAWIDGLLKGQLPKGSATASCYHVDGGPLGERKLWLQDDYVKFIRLSQWLLDSSGAGIHGLITNHGYLDNPTFRGMRSSLMQSFTDIYVLDLHGNLKKKEAAPGGGEDVNVRSGCEIAASR
ncbi:MAG: type ISP restriction/modification enzyme, partial [Actinomycetota bacterium]